MSARVWIVAFGLAFAAACGSGGGRASNEGEGSGDAGTRDDAAVPATDASAESAADASDAARDASPTSDASDGAAAFALALPQIQSGGGNVLAHPRIVPIFYASDPMAAQIGQYLSALAASSYWGQATSEYGVGALTLAPTVVLPDPPPGTIGDKEIQALIASSIAADGGSWPAPTPGTIYAYFPSDAVTVTMEGAGGVTLLGCTNFGGYHSYVDLGHGSTTEYSVVARCSDYLGQGGIDFVTMAASHEFAEASTDPTGTGYATVDLAGSGWAITAGGAEVGDLCKLDPTAPITPSDVGFLVQRIWSDTAAAAGHDPCVPVPAGDAYVLGVPEVVKTQIYPGQYVMGLSVPSGSSATVNVHFYSDAPVAGTWTLAATEPDVPQLPDPAHQLSFSFDRTQGQRGDVVHLTVTRAPAATDAGLVTPAPFVITATMGGVRHWYWGVVGD
ncbi:MAG TPA: hypothetical protein VF765_01765 [Polyangiaceae bacterium]